MNIVWIIIENGSAFYTMMRKDVVRIFRIWVQTFLPSVITSVLYFLIFGTVLGSRIGTMQGVPYMEFVIPGLVMMAIVTNAYANTSFSFFQSKFFARSIDEILVSPMPPWLMIAGFVSGGVIRGVMVGALVLIVSLIFRRTPPDHHQYSDYLILCSPHLYPFRACGTCKRRVREIHRRDKHRAYICTPASHLSRRHILQRRQPPALGSVHHHGESPLLPHQRLPLWIPRLCRRIYLDLCGRPPCTHCHPRRNQLVPLAHRPWLEAVIR
jgi:hypothetical protein